LKTVIGVAWYWPSDSARLRSIAPDADQLEATYEDWLRVYDDGLVKLRTAGLNPQRVPIDLDRFVAWCDARGRCPDGASRAAYASEEVRRLHRSQSGARDA
jgi:hypothetical protein